MNRSVLSDSSIKRLLGKKIFIWPYDSSNLKSSSYNLTASQFAFIETKKVYRDDTGHELKQAKREFIVKDGVITIPPHETALIQTEESILVSGDICGTYHSRVRLANLGIGHIGTTLDPHYFGTSLIALHNTSNFPVNINVGDSIVTLMFYKMSKKSKKLHDNYPGRQDLISLSDIKDFRYPFVTPETSPENLEAQKLRLNELGEWRTKPWRLNEQALKKKVHEYLNQFNKSKALLWVNLITGAVQLALVAIAFYTWNHMSQNASTTSFSSFSALLPAMFTALTAIVGWAKEVIVDFMKRKTL